MLFILAAETFQTLIIEEQHNFIQTPDAATEILQFADDTIIFMPAHPRNLTIIMEVLRKFASLLGLHINVQKNGYVPIAIPSQSVPTITNLLGYQTLKLPITYLGLPLTHSKPTNELFEPMLSSL
jgi:hypothetical protein